MIKLNYRDLLVIALVTLIVSIVSEYYISLNEKNDNVLTRLKKNKFKYIFIVSSFGILIHLILSYFRFEEWYCEKVCLEDKCKLICYIPINK